VLRDIHRLENWASLKTNVGFAEQVPTALVDLLSDDKDLVEKAYWKIDNHVVLQSDLSESAKYVPKYLEEVVLKAKYKGSAIELLFQIGNGASADSQLEEDCYREATQVLTRLLENREIVGTKWEDSIREDLRDLKELHSERT
jgi:hypothetical protein